MIQSAASTNAGADIQALSDQRADLRRAAQGFEAIFVRRMLATARASSLAEQGPFTGAGLEQFETMRDEQLAEIAAKDGGFGLARQIEQQLSAMLGQQSAPQGD